MEEKRYTILKDGDFRIENHPSSKKIMGDYFAGLEKLAREKLYTKKEMQDLVAEYEGTAKGYNVELPQDYFFPYNKEFFGLYVNRAEGHCDPGAGALLFVLKEFNKLQDSLVYKV